MSQLRKDPVVGRWVIIATERARRPGMFMDPQQNIFGDPKECPFCNNQDPEIYSVRKQGSSGLWKVKVAPNGTPILTIEAKFKRRGSGLYDVINAHGANEVVIETPEHIANMADLSEEQIALVLKTYAERFRDLQQDKNLQYIGVYKNHGEAAGSRPIGHSRSQIIASPVNPLRVKEKLAGAKKYYEYRDRCIYCDMIRQEAEGGRRLVAETQHFIAITPFAPRFPFEVMILPREHHCDYMTGIKGKENDLACMLKGILSRFKTGLNDPAYNYMLHTAPLRHKARTQKWETVENDYHWHIELVPRVTKVAGFEKGSGFYICPIPPEDTAEFLRNVQI